MNKIVSNFQRLVKSENFVKFTVNRKNMFTANIAGTAGSHLRSGKKVTKKPINIKLRFNLCGKFHTP